MRKFTPHAPLADIFVRESDWQKDDQMPVAHDDLYAQSWNKNFGPNPFEDSPPDNTQDTDDMEYVPVDALENNHPPSLGFPKNSRGAQWNSPLNAKKKIMMKSSKKFKMMIQKSPKKLQEKIHQKNKPKEHQKTHKNPIAKRTHKYSW